MDSSLPPADMDVPTADDMLPSSSTLEMYPGGYVCLVPVAPIKNPPPACRDFTPPLPSKALTENIAFIEGLVRKAEEEDRVLPASRVTAALPASSPPLRGTTLFTPHVSARAGAPSDNCCIYAHDEAPPILIDHTPAASNNALHVFFDRKPDFCLYAGAFSGPAVERLAHYCKEVEKRTAQPYRLLHYETPLADGQLALRLVAPAHCGFKECVGEAIVREHSLEQWKAAAAVLLKKLVVMHTWAPLAFGMESEIFQTLH